MANITLIIRFFFYLLTVIGLFSGVFISKNIYLKIFYFILSIGIVYFWGKYGAPKSPTMLKGFYKLILEVPVFAIGAFGFYSLFGTKIGTIYLVVATIDLMFMYLLGLQGN